MPTRPDDFKVGMHIAVSDYKEDAEVYEERSFMGFTSRPSRPMFNGAPLEILAINLPFICVTDGCRRFGLDTRNLVFTRLNKDFVEEMKYEESTTGRSPKSVARKQRRSKKSLIAEARRNSEMCPRCYNPKTTRIRRGAGEWVRHCEICRLDRPLDDGAGSPIEE